MKDFDLMKKAWNNLMDTLGDIKAKGEIAEVYVEAYDKERRIEGVPITGEVREYCRCGKKNCEQLGAPGHTTRFQLQNASGTKHLSRDKVEAYKIAIEYNKKFEDCRRQLREYRKVCEKVFKTLGYVGKNRTFESYLKAFI